MNDAEKRKQLAKAQRLMRQNKEDLDRRKHWGAKTRMQEYQDAVVNSLDLEPLEEALDSFSQEALVSENLFDRLASQIDFTDLFKASMVDELQEILVKTFKQGGSRVLTVDGESLDVAFDVEPERITDQLRNQEIYLKNLAEDAQERVRDSIIQGAEEGKSIGEMKDDIMEDVEGMTEHRAETIARSETIEASNKGTETAMDEAGIEEAVIDASLDNQICDEGTFSWHGPDNTEYTSCKEWNGVKFDREDLPSIPKDSHPNCRCSILVATD